MRLLDLFCGAGGCAVGYHRAGFADIIGVDNRPQRRYPFRFFQADAMDFLSRVKLGDFDMIHASPPCQAYSVATPMHRRGAHPDLVEASRELLKSSGIPYVIENVVGAPLQSPILLCGMMFGLKLFRHRLFESSHLLLAPLHVPHGASRIGIDGFCTVAGGGNSGIRYRKGGVCIRKRPEDGVDGWRRAMGIDWMTRDELAQAIPPAYTEWIGEQIIPLL